MTAPGNIGASAGVNAGTKALDTSAYSHVMGTYRRLPVEMVRGEGVYLYDSDGTRYIDMLSGLGVINCGHCAPAIADAVAEQMRTLVHTSNFFYTKPMGRLAERLAGHSLGGAVFFCNSGAEANEAAIKFARKYGKQKLGGAHKIVALDHSFHGRTMAALSATGQPEKWPDFEPILPGFVHVPLNDIDAMKAAVDGSVCAVLIEAVQGEGGVWPADPEWLIAVRAVCDERGVLLIIDEVQSGLCRTGKWFAYQHYGITPDAICVAKALANGLPMGAFVTTPELADVLGPGDHASTFGGGPAVAAAANATLDMMETNGLAGRAAMMGEYLVERLDSLAGGRSDLIDGVRGLGLMLALKLTMPIAGEVAQAALAHGLLVNAVRPDAIRMLPPLVITETQVDEAMLILEDALDIAAVGATGQRIGG